MSPPEPPRRTLFVPRSQRSPLARCIRAAQLGVCFTTAAAFVVCATYILGALADVVDTLPRWVEVLWAPGLVVHDYVLTPLGVGDAWFLPITSAIPGLVMTGSAIGIVLALGKIPAQRP